MVLLSVPLLVALWAWASILSWNRVWCRCPWPILGLQQRLFSKFRITLMVANAFLAVIVLLIAKWELTYAVMLKRRILPVPSGCGICAVLGVLK
jgi:hypothetical protein